MKKSLFSGVVFLGGLFCFVGIVYANSIIIDAQSNALSRGAEVIISLPQPGVYKVTASGEVKNSETLEFDSVILRYNDNDFGYTRMTRIGNGETITITPSVESSVQAFVVDTSSGKSDNTGTMLLTFSNEEISETVTVDAQLNALSSGSEASILLPEPGAYRVTASGEVRNSETLEFDSVILRYDDKDFGYTRMARIGNGESIIITPSVESYIQAFVVDTSSGKSDNTGTMLLEFTAICSSTAVSDGEYTQSDVDAAYEDGYNEGIASCEPTPFTGVLPDSIQSYLVLTDDSAPFYLSPGNYVQTFGSEASNTVNIAKYARVQFQNFIGANEINIEEASSEFTCYRSGATAYFNSSSGTLIEIVATITPQTLRFADGSSDLVVSDGNVMLGNQTVSLVESALEAPLDSSDNSESVFWNHMIQNGTYTFGIEINYTDNEFIDDDDLFDFTVTASETDQGNHSKTKDWALLQTR